MDLFFHCQRSPEFRKYTVFILAFVWAAGLICGVYAFYLAGDQVFSLLCAAFKAPVSVFSFVVPFLLPFVFTAIVVSTKCAALQIFVVFFKAFSVAFLGICVMAAGGESGWLLRGLLLFSEIWTLPVLWLCWLRLDGSGLLSPGWCVMAAASASLLIGSLDYAFISPYFTYILSFQKG